MSNFLKGDINCFRQKQLDLICDIIEKLNLKGKQVAIEPMGKPGDNMASTVLILKISDEKASNIIIKLTPYSNSDTDLSVINNAFFNNEIILYNEVLTMMNQLQEDAGVAEKDYLKFPKYYGSISERSNEIILLEDVRKEHYVMLDKFNPLSHRTIKLILTKLATYHSLSYVLKYKFSSLFTEYCEKLINIFTLEESTKNAASFLTLGEDISKIFNEEKYKQIVTSLFREYYDETFKLQERDKRSRHSVIIHGDCWTNNILFQLKDGEPAECILIDYQLARKSLPVVDILNLIFNCTDYKTRSEHLSNWLDFYYSELENKLLNFGLKINIVYPRDKFDIDMKKYAKVNLGFAIFACMTLLRETNEASALKDAVSNADNLGDLVDAFNVSDLKNDTLSNIKDRVQGLIDTSIEFGFVNVNH